MVYSNRIFFNGVPLSSVPYNAIGDGVTDDTVAIQAALTAAKLPNGRGGTVWLPAGTFKITSTLVADDMLGLRLCGAGLGSILLWGGNTTDAMLRLSSVQDADVRDINLHTDQTKPLAVGVHCYSRSGATYVSRHNHFTNVYINGTSNGVAKGFQIGGSVGSSPSGWDANNDFHTLDHCCVSNYSNIAFSLENSQVYDVQFRNCLTSGGGYGQIGVSTKENANRGGNFSWIGGGGGGNVISDFYFGDPNSSGITIQNATFENSSRFLMSGGPSAFAFFLDISMVRWHAFNLHADGNMIDFRFPGPISIRNCNLGNYTSKPTSILWSPGGAAALKSFIFEGNVIDRSTGTALFSGTSPTDMRANIVNGAAYP